MTIRLSAYVICGEMRNSRNFTTFGNILLRGAREEENCTLHVELVGDCGPDLKGKVFRFEPRADEPQQEVFDPARHRGFNMLQNGVTGTITNQGWVRALPCGTQEYLRRSELGEPPPTKWMNHFCLEWFGQSGRVLIEFAGALVEEKVRAPRDAEDEGEWKVIHNLAPPPPGVIDEVCPEPHIEVIEWDAEETWEDAETEEEEDARFLREQMLMDQCLASGQGQPVGSLLEDCTKLPRPETLNDGQVETQLKTLLAALAVHGIALDICDHFTPRDCYRFMLDEVLPDFEIHPELSGTGWVQHVCTWEFCAQCAAENEELYGA